jgi:hypothetical protein
MKRPKLTAFEIQIKILALESARDRARGHSAIQHECRRLIVLMKRRLKVARDRETLTAPTQVSPATPPK